MTTCKEKVPPPLLHALEELLFPDIWVPRVPTICQHVFPSAICVSAKLQNNKPGPTWWCALYSEPWGQTGALTPASQRPASRHRLRTKNLSSILFFTGTRWRGGKGDGDLVAMMCCKLRGRVWYLVIFSLISLKCVEILFCFGGKWANYLLFCCGCWFYKWLVWSISLIGCHSNVW